ncbi:MAG: uroporphyrinogen-III C-methyltransferase [Acidobacteriota bacterium]
MGNKGKVYLVGAGPGDPGLATVRARELVEKADVLVYDRLVSERIVRWAPADCEIIYVGKESSRHTVPQDGINQVLVDKALEGKMVVRLKGGDPFVFGRGGEEALVLREQGIDFEIVPGVTSAIAAPAYAGIPVTHRDFTSTLAIITGHEKPDKEDSSIQWDKISTGAGTLVFLMGIENLPNIVENLTKNGRAQDTPVALVRWGTTTRQQVLKGTLATIVDQVKSSGFKPPAVIVVGEVVNLRDDLAWFDNRPLFGKRVVVTRARKQASQLVARLEELGAEVIEFPTIAIKRLDDPVLEHAIKWIHEYSWIIFTSANGVEEFFDRVWELGFDVRDIKGPAVCAIGPATARELEKRGIRVAIVPPEYRAEAVAEALKDKVDSGDKVLIPRARGAREILPETLREWGVEVDEIEIYEAVTEDNIGEEERASLQNSEVDVITFTSSSTVTNFLQVLGSGIVDTLKGKVRIACIGPITADTARQSGFAVDLVAADYTIDGLIDALLELYSNK